MRRLYVRPGETIKLGREGENKARQWVFDFSRWVDTFGEGAVQLIVQRPGECQPYPVPLEIEGEDAVWTVTNIDTSVVGTGKAEFQYYVGETLEKSAVFTTSIVDALGEPSDTPPDAYEHYMEAMLEVASRAEVAKQEAEKAADKAEQAMNSAGFVEFEIGENGHLYLIRTENIIDDIDFELVDGRLEVIFK